MRYKIEIYRNGKVKSLPGSNVFLQSDPAKLYELYIYVFIVKGNGKTLIIETGCGDVSEINKTNMEQNSGHNFFDIPEEERTASIISRANIDPGDVDFVLLTHFHHDHCSNVDLFPNAKIVLSENGWLKYLKRDRFYFDNKTDFPSKPLNYISSLDPAKLILVRQELNILEGISAFWVGGHTPCCVAYEVLTEIGRAVFTSDIAFVEGNITRNHPTGNFYDLKECYKGYEKIRKRADIILTTHDPDILNKNFKEGKI
ncbi:MAG: MBL fold metallo-hydrolase [Actinobacteria bacterium]|nr:MBL fold metallo-hydrolase [Actinomycetota bacterium]